MTRRVWKYTLDDLGTLFAFDMPEGAEIIHVHEQNGSPTMWALVDDFKPKTKRVFYICGTGMDVVQRDSKYIGTTHHDGFVWHIFEMVEPEKPYIRE